MLGVVGARFFKFLFLLDRFTFLALVARLVFLVLERLERLATGLVAPERSLFLVRLVPAGERRFLAGLELVLVLRFLMDLGLASVRFWGAGEERLLKSASGLLRLESVPPTFEDRLCARFLVEGDERFFMGFLGPFW